jgi:hypothetical protein
VSIQSPKLLILPSVFSGCSNLKNVSITGDDTSLREGLFKGCEQLVKVSIPDTIKYMESHVFDGCINLKQLNIPKSLSHISKEAFNQCYTYLTMPNNILKHCYYSPDFSRFYAKDIHEKIKKFVNA